MNRCISKGEDDYYTDILKVVNAIGGRSLNYNWLITEIETSTGDYFYEEYVILSNDELLDNLENKEIQWIWGTFSAIPKKYKQEEILKYNLPGVENIDKKEIKIQHPLAEIEIIAYDSTFVQLIAKDKTIAEKFKKLYKKAYTTLKKEV
ncbi:MAG TPA: hypothetical protein IAD45_05890 [Candidatus Faecimonas intestinavium]|nr:hypothetical protein [Candidatus Faecimonas intestinavium]